MTIEEINKYLEKQLKVQRDMLEFHKQNFMTSENSQLHLNLYNTTTEIINVLEDLQNKLKVRKTRYYVEFGFDNNPSYDMQSKWFDTKAEAEEWLNESIDYIADGIKVWIMKAVWEDDEMIGDIETECQIK